MSMLSLAGVIPEMVRALFPSGLGDAPTRSLGRKWQLIRCPRHVCWSAGGGRVLFHVLPLRHNHVRGGQEVGRGVRSPCSHACPLRLPSSVSNHAGEKMGLTYFAH